MSTLWIRYNEAEHLCPRDLQDSLLYLHTMKWTVEHLFNVSLRSPGHFITYNEVDHLCPCDLQDIFRWL